MAAAGLGDDLLLANEVVGPAPPGGCGRIDARVTGRRRRLRRDGRRRRRRRRPGGADRRQLRAPPLRLATPPTPAGSPTGPGLGA